MVAISLQALFMALATRLIQKILKCLFLFQKFLSWGNSNGSITSPIFFKKKSLGIQIGSEDLKKTLTQRRRKNLRLGKGTNNQIMRRRKRVVGVHWREKRLWKKRKGLEGRSWKEKKSWEWKGKRPQREGKPWNKRRF